MCAVQRQLLLLHIEGYRFVDFHFTVFHVCDGPVFLDGSERVEMGAQAMLVQLALDDGVVVPEDKSVFRCLVLGDAEFGVHIFLHTVVVTVQVVRCDVHQYGNVGTEVIHIVQLEGTQLNDVVIMLLRGYLQGQAVADVAGEADVQACTLEDVINERGGCSLSVRAGDTDHLCVSVPSRKLYLRDDGRTFFL